MQLEDTLLSMLCVSFNICAHYMCEANSLGSNKRLRSSCVSFAANPYLIQNEYITLCS